MVNRITRKLEKLRSRGEKALIAYLCAGDPNLEASRSLVLALEEAGADVVELGIPFSDPLADGPVIQAAAQRALAAGTNLKKVLHLVAGLRQVTELPLALMTYYNPLLSFGLPEFCLAAAKAGVDGLIVPDLPAEENGELFRLASEQSLGYVPLVAPTTPPERLARLAAQCTAFVYCVSLTGVTGTRSDLPEGLPEYLERVKKATDRPVCLGFGVSTPEQARVMAGLGDGVIVGSALIRLVEEHLAQPERMLREVAGLAGQLKKAAQQA